MKYMLQAEWEDLVKRAERYEALSSMVSMGGSALVGLPRSTLDQMMDEEVERQGEQSYRASGDCICRGCGKPYRKHRLGGPIGFDGVQFLNRLCDGSLVKL